MSDFIPMLDRLILRLSPPWFDWWHRCAPARYAFFLLLGLVTAAIVFVEKGLEGGRE
jgi:hypothetical protein